MEDNKDKEIKDLIEKVSKNRDGKLDLSSDEDLSIAIMNLISIEEHFFFTGSKTGKPDYYDLLNITREMRKDLLKRIIKEYEGEVWCISKHLLAASMRIMEVGTKQLGQGNKQEAEDLFSKAYDLYCLFWAVNLKQIDLAGVKKIAADDIAMYEKKESRESNSTAVIKDEPNETAVPAKLENEKTISKFRQLVNKLVDCCKE